jgi:hypothetical protein
MIGDWVVIPNPQSKELNWVHGYQPASRAKQRRLLLNIAMPQIPETQ